MSNLPVYFLKNASLVTFCSVLVFIYLFLSSTFSTISALEADTAKQISLASSDKVIKEFLDDANKSLTVGNTTKTLSDLFMVQRILAQISVNSSSIQESTMLIRETMQAVVNGHTNMALTNIGLIAQQLVAKTQDNQTSNTTIIPSDKATPLVQLPLPDNKTSKILGDKSGSSFLIYDNPIFGIKILYPESWSVRNFGYHDVSNNTIVAFFSPSRTGSQVGNLSGMSEQFVPYLDIYVFDSKNMSLAKIIENRINRIKNYNYFAIDESKEFPFRGNSLAHILVYSTTIGEDELFKKLQVYTVYNNKVYLITFTSQENIFTNFLPTVQKMIDSLELRQPISE